MLGSVELRCDQCDGSATLMGGKSATCRSRTSLFSGLRPAPGQRPARHGTRTASRRLAAHQSGRAISV